MSRESVYPFYFWDWHLAAGLPLSAILLLLTALWLLGGRQINQERIFEQKSFPIYIDPLSTGFYLAPSSGYFSFRIFKKKEL